MILLSWINTESYFAFIAVLILYLCKKNEFMENIIRKIRMYYPVSDEALEALVCLFKRFVFPEKTTIIHAGKQDRKVYFIEKGISFFGKPCRYLFSIV